MHRFGITLLLSFIFLTSCQDSNSENQFLSDNELDKKKALVQQVMAVHDEAMPWLDDIHQLKKLTEAKKDSLNSDSLNLVINQFIVSLDSADEAMMNWMRNYREPKDDIGIDSIETYLSNQFKKATIMRNYMSVTMEKTREFIEQ